MSGVNDYSTYSEQILNPEDVTLVIDENKLPELIQGQIAKLNELNAGVKKALESAEKAEKHAQDARNLSAGWSLFNDRKKEAIEGLQQVGVELAEAVQLGTHAQKISFEFQARLTEVTKYLFTLGVGNIAATRIVVRELEMRLHGASDEELSDLARQEVLSVIRQLKEQEDLLWKQKQMNEALREHDIKIDCILGRVDHAELSVIDQREEHRTLTNAVETIEKASEKHRKDILLLQKQAFAQQIETENLTSSLMRARSDVDDASMNMLKRISVLDGCLKDQDILRHTIESKIEKLEEVSQSHQLEILALQQQVVMHQANLRRTIDVRSALFVIWVTALSAAVYILLRA